MPVPMILALVSGIISLATDPNVLKLGRSIVDRVNSEGAISAETQKDIFDLCTMVNNSAREKEKKHLAEHPPTGADS